jgi:lipopolysaccharide export system permease protein
LKKIDLFILRSYLGPFILTFFIAVFILLMQFVWKYIDDLVGKGLEWSIILELLGLVSLTTFSLALPLAILFSSLMAFGNLGEYMELTALKASGISLQRIMRPVFVFCLLMSIAAFYFSNNILPIANLKMKTLLADITQKRPELNIKPGVFNEDIDKYVIRIGSKTSDGKELSDIMIYDHSRENGNKRLIVAERGTMGQSEDKHYLELRLYNGYTYNESEPAQRRKGQSFPFLREQFKEDLIRFDLSIFQMAKTDERLYMKNYQMLNLAQLEAETDTLKGELKRDRSFIPTILFRSPFFDLEKSYSSEFSDNEKRRTLSAAQMPRTKLDTQQIDTGESHLRSRIKLMQVMKGAPIDSVPPIAKAEPVTIENSGVIQLKDRKNVLMNFSPSEQLRILEQASNGLRSSKSSLDFSIQSFDLEEERIYRHQIEWHRKFTLSFACLVLFFIGAPLGAIVKRGGLGMPVVFSLIFFVAYHMVSITGEKLAREAVATPFWGMWLSSAVLLPIGMFLTYKATRDSVLFDREVYLRFLRKIFSRSQRSLQV